MKVKTKVKAGAEAYKYQALGRRLRPRKHPALPRKCCLTEPKERRPSYESHDEG